MNKLSCFAVLAALAGCAATPKYDRHFGDAVRQARTAMTMNPGASANPDPVAGIDGQAAATALTRYQDSFKAPPPPPPLISLSASASAGASGTK
jgi:predicted component of type VI protein secretion system